jgi:hypothetical protein
MYATISCSIGIFRYILFAFLFLLLNLNHGLIPVDPAQSVVAAVLATITKIIIGICVIGICVTVGGFCAIGMLFSVAFDIAIITVGRFCAIGMLFSIAFGITITNALLGLQKAFPNGDCQGDQDNSFMDGVR